MRHSSRLIGLLAVVLAAHAPSLLFAQDSLRILHVRPAELASPVEAVVIDFDHPVAPRLDASVNPATVLRITPAVGARVFWRDPSTIVAEFDSAWAPGARYEIRIDPRLRSATGLPLASTPPIAMRVRMPRLMDVFASTDELEADTVAHPAAVFDGTFDLGALARGAWFVPQLNCRRTDSVALRPMRIRRIAATDSWEMREAGDYQRDRRLDSLRRVVEFDVAAVLARGCEGEIRLPEVIGDSMVHREKFRVRLPFRLAGVSCEDDQQAFAQLPRNPRGERTCNRHAIVLAFTNSVTPDEIRANVLVNGQPARVDHDRTFTSHTLLDSVQAKTLTRITIRATLRNSSGERLGRDTTIVMRGNPLPASVGYARGRVLVPRNAPTFFRIRNVNADSVVVVIARVPDSLRSTVLDLRNDGYFRRDAVRWEKLVRDSVVRAVSARGVADNERVVDIPTSWIPLAWRNDPMLLVRAVPSVRPVATPRQPRATSRSAPRVSGGAQVLDTLRVVGSTETTSPYFALVQRSDVAVHAVGTQGSTDVWVTSLRSAEPRAGVVVRVLDDAMRMYARAITDTRGRATLTYAKPKNENVALHLEADAGSDRALLLLTSGDDESDDVTDEDSLGTQRWYGTSPKLGDRWLHGSAFTERGIYRPGERVFLGGAVRTFNADAGYRTPAGDSARWSVWYAGERVWSHAGRLSDFGTMPDSFSLGRSAPLGSYAATLALRVDGAWRTAGRAGFTVAEYRAPEFAVKLDADTVTPLFAGDTARLRIAGRYLFGLPMDGGGVRWWWSERSREGWEQRIPGLERYTVGRSAWRVADEARAKVQPNGTGTGVLAADGSFAVQIPTVPTGRPAWFEVNVTVTDANRQAVTSGLSLALHAADAYVGMRTRERRYVWKAGESIAVELFVVRADGTPRVGDAITLVAQRTRWINRRTVRDTVWRTSLTSAAAPVVATFRPANGGSYELIASVADERGRSASSGLDTWVAGGSATWAAKDPREITLRSERTQYAPGDEVSLVVESSAEQRAWVSLRREGILYERLVDLHAGVNELRVPVPVNAAPRAQIRVIAVRPYGAQGTDSAGIYYRAGSLRIDVDSKPRALQVVLAPARTRYRPGDTVRVAVNVHDAAGTAMRADATVWAVDQGVVSLTDFVRPAVLAMLTADNEFSVWQSSTLLAWMLPTPPAVGPDHFSYSRYGSMAGNSVMKLSAPAVAAGGMASDVLRRSFATTPFFAGNVRTDGNGRASVSFMLPDNVGTFRLYAAVVASDVYAGSGDTSIISTRPLLVRAALPRIVRIGDTLFAGAVMTQEASGRTPVTLSVATTNVLVSGATTLTDTLDTQRARELRFPLTVTGGDSVTFVFRGSASGADSASDAVETRLAVSPPGRARAHVVTGLARGSEDVTLAIPKGTDSLRSHVSLQLGVSALPLVRQFSEALRVYPYYCTEQVSSAGRALLARIRLQRALGDSAALTEGERRQLESAVSILLRRQRADGGYGYWSNTHWTSPWLTAYVLDFFLGARDLGVTVPANSLDRAKTYLASAFPRHLRESADPFRAWRDSVAWPHNALAAAYLLRRASVPDTTLERDLWALRDKLGFEDRLTLAGIYIARVDSARARTLLDDAWRSARVEGRRVTLDDSAAARRWLFRSVSRPIALLLATTARLQPEHPQLGALFESLVQTGRSEQARWWNTLDHAAVAEALAEASRAMSLSAMRRIAVSGPRGVIADVVVQPQHADTLRLTLAQLTIPEGDSSALRVRLASPAPTPTYFAMTLFEVPAARPVRADDAGIGVERWYESFNGGSPITEVREGELVRVRLRITVPADREFVVVDDALPAGLEAIDLSLRTSAALPPFEGAPRLTADMNEGPPGQRWLYGSWDGGWWTPWEHKEIRDDRVLYFARQLWKGSYQASYVARATTAGTFVRPPAQAEEMYNPAVRGRSDGGTFTITRAPRAP